VRSGAGSARKEHWEAARRNFVDQVQGDVVTGTKIELNLADKSVLVAELSIDLLEPVRYAFVEPPNWAATTRRFAETRTVILRGRAGDGKDAAAIRLLTGEVQTIYHLDPGIDVTGLPESITKLTAREGRDERGIGFLLCQPTDARKLRGYTFHALESALTAANARLVVTMRPEILPADTELENYVIDLVEPSVSRRQIVLSHLSWRCNDEEALANLLANAGVESLVGELVDGGHTCQSAADLASIINSERTDEGLVNIARIRERRRRQRDHAFDVWFDGLRGADERSFAIALAVLDGLPYEDVADAARRLRAKLEPSQPLVVSGGAKPELRVARRDLLQTSTRRLLDTVRAVECDEKARYSYGLVPVRVVTYRDELYPKRILERVWRGHQIQPTVLSWLYELILSQSEQVRYFAANAVGLLARFSFDYVRTSSLERWAASKDARLREAAAYAMREPAADPRLTACVTRVVSGWFADEGFPFRQATAARAFGVDVGQPDRATAIDRLGRLATVDDYDVCVAIGDALADFVLDDTDRMAPQVCMALLEWIDDPNRVRSAELAFLILASTVVTWEPVDDKGTEVMWPTLLRLAGEIDGLWDSLSRLWRHLICNSVLQDLANSVLTRWAGMGETNVSQLRALLRLIGGAATGSKSDARVRRNLRVLTREWIKPKNLTPLPQAHRAVNALIDKLEQEGR
jgi:hypothetical protein